MFVWEEDATEGGECERSEMGTYVVDEVTMGGGFSRGRGRWSVLRGAISPSSGSRSVSESVSDLFYAFSVNSRLMASRLAGFDRVLFSGDRTVLVSDSGVECPVLRVSQDMNT